VDEAQTGCGWLHEIKYDGYRMHALHERADICLVSALTATCNEAGIVSRVVDGAVGLGLAFV
jgi:hypothetical protein